MRKIDKIILWIGGFIGSWMTLNGGTVQVNTETKGEITTIKIDYHRDDDSKENERIQLRKAADHWSLVSEQLLDKAHFDLSDPTEAHCLVDGLELKLRANGELYLSGEYLGDLLVEHLGKVIISPGQSFKVEHNFFLNKAIAFENSGSLEVGKNWLCLLTGITNNGDIVVKQGWQVLALQTLENTVSGRFTVLRADIVSPGTRITNRGQMNAILNFNGESCDFINHAGKVNIGENCTLKSLVNKSETEPVIGGFVEVKREFFDNKGKILDLTKVSGPYHQTLTSYHLKLGHTCEECRTDRGNGQQYIGYVRKIFQEQTCEKTEGQRGVFYCNGTLNLQGNSICLCGDIFIGENLNLTHGLNLYGYACNMREVESVWTCTSMRGWHGRGYFCDSFVDKSSVLKIKKLHPAHVEVVGSVVGAVETFINSKVDAAQPGVVKGLEEALMQHQEKLQVMAEEADILPILADPEGYEADLAELKTNPGFATMVRLQEMRRARSEVASVVPSRQSSPGMEE